MPGRLAPVLPSSAGVSASGHLIVGGCDLVDLADEHGTPLYVFDRAEFEARCAAFASAVGLDHVFYAGKSFLCIAVCELVESLGLGLDVASGGELATALRAGFPAARIVFHGNNKSLDELSLARDAGVGRIVVDSFEEIDRIAKMGLSTRLLVRVTPGVEAHTHEYVQTGREDQKFGFTLADGVALEAVRRITELSDCEFAGIHAHIGSQIFELSGFDLAVLRLADFAAQLQTELDVGVDELNLGGGFGIAYLPDDDPLDPATITSGIVDDVASAFSERNLPPPGVFVEPGRAISGPACVTLYTVGTVKEIAGVRTYVSVDGGMSDNIRPALYGARYEALLANRVGDPHDAEFTVAGKHCEPDTLIVDARLPSDLAPDDLLCVPATGAYTHSMASNYNRVPRPPVVMVWDGRATEVVRRESVDDLLALDRRLDGSSVSPHRPSA